MHADRNPDLIAYDWEVDEWRARPPVRRPLVGVLLAGIAGMLLAAALPISATQWLALGWLLLMVAWIPWLAGARTLAVFALAAACGGAHGAMSRAPPAPEHLANRMRRQMEHIRLVGIVADDPVRETGRRADTWVWRFPIVLERDFREAGWRRARGRVEVRLETARAEFSIAYGERWQLEGVVRRGGAGVSEPPRLSMGTDDRAARRLSGAGGWRLRRWCLDARRWVSARLAAGVAHEADAVALIRALMVGYRQELPLRVREAFARSGTLHIVAISGAHVGMMAMLLLTVVRATGLSQPRWIWVMGPLLLFYAMGTGLAPSAVRACLMAVIFYSAYGVWREPDSQSALALAAMLILAVAPAQLDKPGFILSFSVVAGLILLTPPVRDWLYARVGSPTEESGAFRMTCVEPIRRAGLDLLAVTFVAWIISTPLTAHFFNLFSPAALLANLVVVPLAFVILFSASLALTLGALHPLIMEIFNFSAVLFARGLLKAVELSLRAPGAFSYVETPPIWITLVSLLAVVCLFRGARWMRVVAGIGLLALIAGLLWRSIAAREFSIAVRHLGPAAVAHVAVPGGGDWLVDTGPAFTAPRLVRFLNERGVDRLRVVALTRGTLEAAGGLPALLAARQVEEVWAPDAPYRSRAFERILDEAARSGVRVVRIGRGAQGTFGPGGAHWQVLHPETGRFYPSAAAGGMVLRIAHHAAAATFSPGPDERLAQALAVAPQDYGGQALIELGMRGEEDVAREPWRPGLVLRPENPGSRWNPHREGNALWIPEGETVRLQARGAGFDVRAVREWALNAD